MSMIDNTVMAAFCNPMNNIKAEVNIELCTMSEHCNK